MSEEKSVHPLRRRGKHRRGRRKKKETPVEPLALAPMNPDVLRSLRNRLSLLSKQRSA